MPSKQEIQQYLDLLARALCIAHQFPAPFQQMAACPGYEKELADGAAALDRAWGRGLPALFRHLDQALLALEEGPKDVARCIRATAVCLWMDQKIHYAATGDPRVFSLYNLLPLSGDRPVCTGPVNTNCAATGVQVHPRYEVAGVYDQAAGRLRPLGNRDAFEGLNGRLHNVCYTTHRDSRYVIRHVILPYDYAAGREDGPLRVAFSPMSSNPKLLRCSTTELIRGGVRYTGIQINGLYGAKQLEARFIRDWHSSCANGVNLFFGPEMLGTPGMAKRDGKYHALLRPLSLDAMALGRTPPALTFLPSVWRDGENSTTVVYQDGTILGVQPKYMPYVDASGNRMEALREQAERHLLVLHIPGVHRIVVMICADFLDIQSPETRKLICGELGATLILVPSYSHGEQDFVNLLPALKSYGATVVWGDNCGAVRPPRVIGGCSIAGTDGTVRFGPQCLCGGSCKGRHSCLFLLDLPVRLTRAKPDAPQLENLVRHILH